jgi:hypothetical protein
MGKTMDLDDLPDISYGTIDRSYAEHLATAAPEDDGPVWMVNLMRYRERAVYADGRETDLTGKQADDTYAPFGPLRTVGAELVFVSDVEAQPGADEPAWDRVAVVRYPTRRSFFDMQMLPEYQELHVHKDAGMDTTIIVCCQPAATPPLPAGAPEPGAVPHPSTDDDGPVVVLHLLRYDGDRRDDGLAVYEGAAGRIALPHGVRITAWLDVEGTIVGDGRTWHEARFHTFPSRAAFEAVAFDPDRIAAQMEVAEPAVADAYTVVLRPLLDRLADSLPA